MRRRRAAPLSVGALLLAATLCSTVRAQNSLLDLVHTVTTAPLGAPVEIPVTLPAAGTYTVKLTDLGSPSLASLEMVATYQDAIVGTPTPLVVNYSSGTSAQMTLTASAADTPSSQHLLHIIGTPNGLGSGPIGVQITDSSGGVVFSASSDIAPAAQAPANNSGQVSAQLEQAFAVQLAGSYTVALNDLALPQPFPQGQLLMLLVQIDASGNATSVATLSNGNGGTLSSTVTLDPADTYHVLALAQTAANITGGLFSVVVTPQSGSAVYTKTEPVGTTVLVGSAALATAGSYSLLAADLAFPSPLDGVTAMLVCSGQAVLAAPLQLGAGVTTPASVSFDVPASAGAGGCAAGDTYLAFAAATAAVAGAGSYVVEVQSPSGAVEFGGPQAVTTPGGTLAGYTFSTAVPSSGNYTVALADFPFPSNLAVADLAAVQGTSLVGTPLTTTGSFTTSTSAGTLGLVVFAQPGSGGSLFDVNVAGSGGSVVFDETQAVGAQFAQSQVAITNPGAYAVTVTDLGFPAGFSAASPANPANGELAVVVTQAGTQLGSIFGGGSFTFQASKGGNYYVNVLAIPSSAGNAGTYAVNLAPAPAPPTVNFSADAASVSPGAAVHLIWTTQAATSCVGSGGGWSGTWTGSQAASNTTTSPSIETPATFTLTCAGPGGSTAQSVKIEVSSSSRGGGGIIGLWSLAWLAACLGYRTMSRKFV